MALEFAVCAWRQWADGTSRWLGSDAVSIAQIATSASFSEARESGGGPDGAVAMIVISDMADNLGDCSRRTDAGASLHRYQ